MRYRNVFRGVDLNVHGHDRRIEYDWIVAPGADPRTIHFSFTGAANVWVDPGGDLVLDTGGGEVRHTRPRILQSGHEIAGRFVLHGEEVRFEIAGYDVSKPLIIDPVVVVNTSFGGSGIKYSGCCEGPKVAGDTATGIATDSAGNIYITGTTFSTDFPLVHSLQGPPSQACQFNCEFSSIFVTKLSPDGGTLLYSTYIGAPSAPTPGYSPPPVLPAAIAADPSGMVYVTGTTSGVNFPGVTATAGGNDAFVLRLDPAGALIGTKLFGGNGDDEGTSIVLGPDGYIYLAGTTQSPDFPVTQSTSGAPTPGAQNAFVVKLSFTSIFGQTNGTVVYSTLTGQGTSAAVAADAGGNAYIATAVTSPIAVMKLDPLGRNVVYSTSIGGTETPTGIAVDSSGIAYIAGTANSSNFPATSGALQTRSSVNFGPPNVTGFVAKLSPDGTSFVYATYLGGSVNDRAMALAVDAAGNAYVGGATTSPDFPLHYPMQSTLVNSICPVVDPDGTDDQNEVDCASGGFLSVLNPSGTALVWSTYLGAGAVYDVTLDAAANVYATGVNIAISPATTTGTVNVLKIAPSAPTLDVPANPVVNAASFATGLPLPGGLASVFVRRLNLSGTTVASGSPLPTELAGVSILVDGVPAPILAVAPSGSGLQQINFQVPFEATSNAVEIRYQGASFFAIPQTAAPGIFVLSDGAAAIEHSADYSLVTPSNPAHPGEAIIVYATGLGHVVPAIATGAAAGGPAPLAPGCTQFYGSIGAVLYAGLTPGFAGLYQMNIQLPQSLPSGMLQFSIGGVDLDCALLPAGGFQSNIVNLPVQ